MDQYPLLETWLTGEFAGGQALIGVIFLTALILLSAAYLMRRYPARSTQIAQWLMNGYCLLAVIYMLVIH